MPNAAPKRVRPEGSDLTRVGGRIKEARTRAGLSQRALAERVGVTSSAVTQWERGVRAIGVPEIRAVARALGIAAAWFLGPDEEAAETSVLAALRANVDQMDERDQKILVELSRLLAQPHRVPVARPLPTGGLRVMGSSEDEHGGVPPTVLGLIREIEGSNLAPDEIAHWLGVIADDLRQRQDAAAAPEPGAGGGHPPGGPTPSSPRG